MAVNVHTDVTDAISEELLRQIGEQYAATAEKMGSGIDMACNQILKQLADTANTIDGAEHVHRKVGEFDGSLISTLENGSPLENIDQTILFGTGCLTQLAGEGFDAITDAVRRNADVSQYAATNIVGLAAALTLDVLGLYKRKFGLKRDNLTEILRSQSELAESVFENGTGSDTLMRNLGLQPGQVQASSAEPEHETPNGITDDATTTPELFSPENKSNVEPPQPLEAGEPEAGIKPEKTGDSASTARTAPGKEDSSGNQIGRSSKPSRLKEWMKVGVLLLILLGAGLYGWQILEQETESLRDSIESPKRQVVSFEGPAQSADRPTRPTVEPHSTATKSIVVTRLPETGGRVHAITRYESNSENDFGFVGDIESVLAGTAAEYWWDDQPTAPALRDGYLKAGPWQVSLHPRNTCTQSYYSFQ